MLSTYDINVEVLTSKILPVSKCKVWYESALSCITSGVTIWSEMQNQGRRDFIDIGPLHYVHVVKSIL